MDHQEKSPQRLSKKPRLRIYTNSLKEEDNLNQKHPSPIQESVKLVKCAICNFSTKWKGNLKIHVKGVHYKEKPFKCEICPSTFATTQHLNTHTRTVHENVEHEKTANVKCSRGNKLTCFLQ